MRDHGCKMRGLVLSGLLLALLGSGQGYAQQIGAPSSTEMETNRILAYKADLKLTEGQERQLRPLLAELGEVRSRQRARLERVTHELTELLKEGVSAEQEEALRVALSFQELDVMGRIDAALSPEQLTHWRNIQDMWRQGKRKS
ncbi:MAG: hypothetical protein NTX84_03460 [Nitrospirae bacterium]|nr:hypothetical protein [Nitrospirota bacterium]